VESKEEYRVPFSLATSEDVEVSTRFLRMIPPGSEREPTRFTIHFTDEDGQPIKCVHVNYLEAVSTVKGEAEWLFTAFSVFSPFRVIEQEKPTADKPHEVWIRASRDNLDHSEYVLLADWH